MNKAKVVSAGVDTLVLNAFYTDERGRPCKRELDPSLWRQLEEWKRAAQEAHEECPTTLLPGTLEGAKRLIYLSDLRRMPS